MSLILLVEALVFNKFTSAQCVYSTCLARNVCCTLSAGTVILACCCHALHLRCELFAFCPALAFHPATCCYSQTSQPQRQQLILLLPYVCRESSHRAGFPCITALLVPAKNYLKMRSYGKASTVVPVWYQSLAVNVQPSAVPPKC